MTEEETLMRDILKSAAGIYANMGIKEELTYRFDNKEIPILPFRRRIRIVLSVEEDDPQPLPVGERLVIKELVPA